MQQAAVRAEPHPIALAVQHLTQCGLVVLRNGVPLVEGVADMLTHALMTEAAQVQKVYERVVLSSTVLTVVRVCRLPTTAELTQAP